MRADISLVKDLKPIKWETRHAASLRRNSYKSLRSTPGFPKCLRGCTNSEDIQVMGRGGGAGVASAPEFVEQDGVWIVLWAEELVVENELLAFRGGGDGGQFCG